VPASGFCLVIDKPLSTAFDFFVEKRCILHASSRVLGRPDLLWNSLKIEGVLPPTNARITQIATRPPGFGSTLVATITWHDLIGVQVPTRSTHLARFFNYKRDAFAMGLTS
jgi:hypothetical protein